jgi:outer membrane protein assembly factor BamB
VHRRVVLLALVACEAPAPPLEAPPPAWVYPPSPTSWPLGKVIGRIGRSQAPQPALHAGITGTVRFPLRSPTPWTVPGDGPARAVIYGLEGVKPAIELIEIDAGRVVWRDTTSCVGPVVGVTADAIVCADANGVRGLGLDGKQRWRSDAPFIAMTDERVVLGPTGESVIVEADSGEELARVELPAGVLAESILASCGDVGRELFATAQDGKLTRIADVKGRAAIAWSTPIGAIEDLEACEGGTVIVKTPGPAGSTLIALARETGKETGRVESVRGWWPARRGTGIEVATGSGVSTWSRDLATAEPLALAALGELLAKRGDRRLVRATPLTAVLLDAAGVRAYIELSAMGAVLGDDALIAASWTGSDGETVRRLGLPERYARVLRIPARHPGVAVPAELRDLPAVKAADLAATIGLADTAKHSISAVAIDPRESAAVYAISLERPTDDTTSAGIARGDLVKRAWTWQRNDACGPGTPIGIAIAHDVVVCGARGTPPANATVRATSRDGKAMWEWEGESLDAVQAAGDTVLAHAADQLFVIDAATGRLRARLVSGDGAPMRAAAIELADGTTVVVSYERGRLVARLPSIGMIPAWSLAIDGVVHGVVASQQGVLVDLEDGDAFRVDAETGEVAAIAGLGLAWRAEGDLVTGSALGGPIPGVPQEQVMAAGPPPLRRRTAQGRRLPAPPPSSEDDPEAPRLWTPIPPPPPLGDSWQYTVYELGGAVRARNDYAITGAVAPAVARGPAGSPLVVAYGDGREVLVVDPRTGDPLRRIALPADAPTGVAFSTVVDGTPVAGTLLAKPLRILLF